MGPFCPPETNTFLFAKSQHWVVAKVEASWQRQKNVTQRCPRYPSLSRVHVFGKKTAGTHWSDLRNLERLGASLKMANQCREMSTNKLYLKPSARNNLQSVHTHWIVFTQAIIVDSIITSAATPHNSWNFWAISRNMTNYSNSLNIHIPKHRCQVFQTLQLGKL
jgi:hypothetical protein